MEDTSKLNSLEIKEAVVTEGRAEGARETYFFERHDGSVISVEEKEAWDIMNGRTPIVGFRYNQPKLIGVSDGQIFQRAILESHGLIRAGKLEEAKAVLQKGKDEELEAARGKLKRPRNFDTIDRRGQPVRISDLR